MNKLDIKPLDPSIEIIDPTPDSHLLILVPGAGLIHVSETRRIWELANATGLRVRILGLCNDVSQASSLRRELITLSALIQFGRVTADVKIEIGTNWLHVVERNCNAGDMIVCFAGQTSGILHKPLNEILESKMKAPVYILSGLKSQESKSNLLSQAGAWLGSIGIIIGFSFLQISIIQLPKNSLQNIMFILSILPEYWLILVWNSLFQ